ncbi:MAG: FmdB family zinc ribbon protein [Trueperaceae bacterium]|jgi:putative FmdB family regulatory protein
MPTYVYRNLVTGETFELQQRITEDALTEHPETGDPVKRLIQPVGIAFKGSGFYVNDSRSSGSRRSAGGAGGAAGNESGAAKGSTESASGTAPAAPADKGGASTGAGTSQSG